MNIKENDNYEIIELLNLNDKTNIEKLKIKLKSKLESLEKLYQEKYIEKQKNINNQIILKQETLNLNHSEQVSLVEGWVKYLSHLNMSETTLLSVLLIPIVRLIYHPMVGLV